VVKLILKRRVEAMVPEEILKKFSEKGPDVWCVCLDKGSLRLGVRDESWNGEPGRVCVYNIYCGKLEGPNYYSEEEVFSVFLSESESAAQLLLSKVRMR
jgi:hypothetical protein